MPISPYVVDLRARIGRRLLLLPSVTVLPHDDDGRVLLVRSVGSGMWDTIGGMVEPDEHPADAAVREASEEAGVDVDLVGIVAVLGGPQFRLTYPNGDEAAYVVTVFDAVVVGGEPRHDDVETAEPQS
ncbi:MAG: NUDIX domain-containing protein [Acidimicrobiia bacterium]|jgi:8-oxo-dGTP pyrophosphatase MutT (NUDIX family)